MICKVILFDVGGVLVNYDRQRTIEAILSGCVAHTSEEDISQLIKKMQVDQGENRVEDLYQVLVDEKNYDSTFREFVTQWTDGLSQRAWVRSLLERLRNRHKLFIVSDTNEEHWSHIDKHLLDLGLFDRIFLSHQLKITKKDDRIFKHVLTEIGFKPEECLFIDDTPSNISVARSVGLQTHHYSNRDGMLECIDAFGQVP